MRYFNICSQRKIQSPEGEKKIYQKIGFIKTTDPKEKGIWYMQLYSHPTADFFVFPSTNEELPVID